MTPDEAKRTAEEIMALRRDVAGLKQALTLKSETNDALRRQGERLEKHLQLLRTEIERIRLLAAKDF